MSLPGTRQGAHESEEPVALIVGTDDNFRIVAEKGLSSAAVRRLQGAGLGKAASKSHSATAG
jgi:hypothetical protein